MSHGNGKAVGGLLSIAFQNSKTLQKALADEGNNPKKVSEFMVRYYQAMKEELANSEAEERD
jgi:hypothetical protein